MLASAELDDCAKASAKAAPHLSLCAWGARRLVPGGARFDSVQGLWECAAWPDSNRATTQASCWRLQQRPTVSLGMRGSHVLHRASAPCGARGGSEQGLLSAAGVWGLTMCPMTSKPWGLVGGLKN